MVNRAVEIQGTCDYQAWRYIIRNNSADCISRSAGPQSLQSFFCDGPRDQQQVLINDLFQRINRQLYQNVKIALTSCTRKQFIAKVYEYACISASDYSFILDLIIHA